MIALLSVGERPATSCGLPRGQSVGTHSVGADRPCAAGPVCSVFYRVAPSPNAEIASSALVIRASRRKHPTNAGDGAGPFV